MSTIITPPERRTKRASVENEAPVSVAPSRTDPHTSPSPWWKRRLGPMIILGIGAIAIAAAALWPAPAASQAPPTATGVVDVRVQPLVPVAQQPDEIRLPAVLEAQRVIKVSAEVAGRIEKVGPKEGTDVEPNQPLLWLNIDMLKAQHDQALAQHELNERELARYQQLETRGVATDIEMYRARAAVSMSKAALTLTSEQLARTVIRSPIGGVLNDILVEPGEYVGPGTNIAEIIQLDQLKVVVHLPERDVVYAKLGQSAKVAVDSVDDLQLDGQISYISAKADETTRTFRTEVTADNRQRRARPGQIVRVGLLRRNIAQAIMIPLYCVIPIEDGYQVYVEEEGKARPRKIQIGLIVGDTVQAVSGLKAGEKLIVAGHRMVSDGGTVRVVR